jgi:hypothetical protein
MSRPVILFVATLALSVTSPARAETGAASVLFDSGRDAMKRGDYAAACPQFEESYRLEPAVGTELNLALCEEQMGRELSAWRRLQHVIDTLPRDDDRLPIARRRRDEIGSRLPRVKLVAAAALPANASIRVGDSPLTASGLGVDIPVERGELKVRVTAPGHESREYSVTLVAGARETLSIAAGPPATPAPRPVRVANRRQIEPSNGRRTAGLVILSAGGALALAGATTGFLAISAKRQMNDECDASFACSSRGLDAAERGKAFALTSTITFAVAGASLAAGSWLLLTSDDGAADSAKLVEVSLVLHPAGAGLTGSFR